MKYCKRCVYPENHPLGLILDEEGICSGCRVHQEKDNEINWQDRFKELKTITQRYSGSSPSGYDCIIPVNGNGDSYYVLHLIKEVLGLNPLLVTYNIQYNTKIGIRNLANLLTKFDCDHLQYTVNPAFAKKITWHAMQEMGDMYWHCLAGEQTFPVQVATKMKIPLIIWGVNGWLDQVGMFSHWDLVEMSKKVRKEHGLRTMDVEQMLAPEKGITQKLMQAFTYPSDEQLEKSRVRGIYLGNFIRWDAQAQTKEMIEKYQYETAPQERTFNRYESIYCHHNAGIHDYLKYLKYGYSKVSDHAARDIRLKRLSREEAIERVCALQAKKPKDLPLLLNWLGVSETEFFAEIEKFRDPQVWKKYAADWVIEDDIGQDAHSVNVKHVSLFPIDKQEYLQTENREPFDEDQEYLLMGRAYIDENNFTADGS